MSVADPGLPTALRALQALLTEGAGDAARVWPQFRSQAIARLRALSTDDYSPSEGELALWRSVLTLDADLVRAVRREGDTRAAFVLDEDAYLAGDEASLDRLLRRGWPIDPRVLERALGALADTADAVLTRDMLRALRLGERAYHPARRLARRALALPPATLRQLGLPSVRIAALGDITLDFLAPLLRAALLEQGVDGEVRVGSFAQIEESVLDPASWVHGFRPDVVLVLSSVLALRQAGDETADLARRRVELARILVDGVRAEVVLTNLEPLPEHTGPAGLPAWLREFNAELARSLPPRAYVFDLAALVSEVGVDRWFDLRLWSIARQACQLDAAPLLADRLARFVRALVEPPVKLVVTDLDGTLWGGLAGEVGAEQIEIGSVGDGVAYARLQRYLKERVREGFLLAACSKNTSEVARAPFLENPEMVLQLEDFVAFEVSFAPKSIVVEEIARRLNLGLQNVLFLDDSPHERGEMRERHREVLVPEWPSEGVAGLPSLLSRSGWLQRLKVTDEDRQRTALYRAEVGRAGAMARYADVDAFLDILELRACLMPVDERNLERVTQLVQKTNQFNLTSFRRTRRELERFLATPGTYARALRLEDRYGPYGMTALLVAVPSARAAERQLVIDLWLMSCRIMGKTVEYAMFEHLLAFAREKGYREIEGIYCPTVKNEIVASLFEELGFVPTRKSEHEQRYVFKADDAPLRGNLHVAVFADTKEGER